jgi:adenylate cyclase class IV
MNTNLNFEIEKKFIIGDFSKTFEMLKANFKNYTHTIKHGFWWCNSYNSIENILEVNNPIFSKKDIILIKNICEILIPDHDFQFVRLRININEIKKYLLTFKIKSIVNKIEHNTEYEFEITNNTFKRLVSFLQGTAFIFYYNIKETWEFFKDDIKIEISKLNDLKDPYLEIETIGNDKTKLVKKLENILNEFKSYDIKEEPRTYLELSRNENKNALRNIKLSQYSKKANIILQDFL